MAEGLRLSPNDPALLSDYAGLLADIGEYRAAIDAINRIKHPDWSALSTKGWALENLGPTFAEEARQTYSAALSQEPPYPDVLWVRKGLANALRLAGDMPAAMREYQEVVKQAAEQPEAIDVGAFSLLGWCHYQLGDYDEALRLLNEAIAAEPQDFPTQFDVGLILACSGRYGLALQQYQKTLDAMTQQVDVLRQAGLLHVALDDLREAIQAQPGLSNVPEVQKCMSSLQDAYGMIV
jgi:tetratricopeptide (TPR) repeat protein